MKRSGAKVFLLEELRRYEGLFAIAGLARGWVTNRHWAARCDDYEGPLVESTVHRRRLVAAAAGGKHVPLRRLKGTRLSSVVYVDADGREHFVDKEYAALLRGLKVVRLDQPKRWLRLYKSWPEYQRCPVGGVDGAGLVAVFVMQRRGP